MNSEALALMPDEQGKMEAPRVGKDRPPDSVLAIHRDRSPHEIEPHNLKFLERHDPEGAAAKWEEIKQAARDELAGGLRSAHAVLPYDASPMDKARFLVLRESLTAQWQPQGGIEQAVIDQLAIAQTYFLEWSKRFADWSQMSDEGSAIDLEEVARKVGEWQNGVGHRRWLAPRLTAAESLETASAMADRWHKVYLRGLRQLSNLRRYNGPLVVNRGGQINVGDKQIILPPAE